MKRIPKLAPREKEALRQAARDQIAINTFEGFARGAWAVVEPGVPLIWNWHLTAL